MPISIWLTFAACVAAAVFDVRARRIPNVLTILFAVAALAVHAFFGVESFLASLAVMAVVTLLGAAAYALGGIGGGDVKLWIAGSGMLGFPLCIPFLLYTLIGGGVLAIGFMVARGGARQSLVRAASMASGGTQNVVRDKTQTLPYAVAFAFGALLVALSQSVFPFLRILQ